MTRKQRALFEPALVRTALIDAVKKLDPRVQWRNPVMFVVYIGSILTTAIWLAILTGQTDGAAAFTGSVSCGCGSPCCSPTSRKRWPKGAARPRRKA